MKQQVICDYCSKLAQQVTGDIIYPHREDLYNKNFWYCKPCNAYVGCHKNGEPLGRLADAKLRKYRVYAHALFDPVWKSKHMTRTEAYQRLAFKLNIPVKECHIGLFDVEMCKRVIALFKKDNH